MVLGHSDYRWRHEPILYRFTSGGVVYEPFGGSGSTLIAAEWLGMRARPIEVDPRYAAWSVGAGGRAPGQGPLRCCWPAASMTAHASR
jgi:hypothetical protein